MKYKRILLKLSGEALMGERQYGIDPKRLSEYAQDIKQITLLGVCLLYTSPSPRDGATSRMPSSA